MNKSRYFSNANAVAQQYSNFGGYSGMIPAYSGADGAMGAGQAVSEPYNFTIVNGGTTDISGVTLLDAFNNLGAVNFGNDSAITITMDNGNITYEGFLRSMGANNFSIGSIYIFCSNSSQVTNTITFEWRDNSGTELKQLVYPKIDPMQQQATALIQELVRPVPVDGYTSISFTLLASATLKLALYPVAIVDVARPLAGRNVESTYAMPNLSQNPLVRRIG